MMKDAFYFKLKAQSVLNIFEFLSLIFGNVEKQSDQKDEVNFKISDVTIWVQHGKQTIAIYIFPSISRSKGNQTMKFNQLTEYKMRNIFPEKIYQKCGGETIPRHPFLKNKN